MNSLLVGQTNLRHLLYRLQVPRLNSPRVRNCFRPRAETRRVDSPTLRTSQLMKVQTPDRHSRAIRRDFLPLRAQTSFQHSLANLRSLPLGRPSSPSPVPQRLRLALLRLPLPVRFPTAHLFRPQTHQLKLPEQLSLSVSSIRSHQSWPQKTEDHPTKAAALCSRKFARPDT